MADGINVVAYVHANPVNLRDPFGTDGVGEMIDNIVKFIADNRALIMQLAIDLSGPLGSIIDLISAATGQDWAGWLAGGGNGEPEAMGWFDRAVAVGAAALTLAAGALTLIPKLKKIFAGIEELVDRARSGAGRAGGKMSPLPGGSCFLAATLVMVANDTLTAIEDIAVGDLVQCEIPAGMPDVSGAEFVKPVTATSKRLYEGVVITIVVEGGGIQSKISGTPQHQFWCVNRHEWVPLGALEGGDLLDGIAGSVRVVRRDVEFTKTAVFNLTVEFAHSYRVSELGVLVHNDCTRRARMLEIMNDPDTPSHIRGWIQQEVNSGRRYLRSPPGYDLAHKHGRMARDGYTHQSSPSNFQTEELHDLQHHRSGGYRY